MQPVERSCAVIPGVQNVDAREWPTRGPEVRRLRVAKDGPALHALAKLEDV